MSFCNENDVIIITPVFQAPAALYAQFSSPTKDNTHPNDSFGGIGDMGEYCQVKDGRSLDVYRVV